MECPECSSEIRGDSHFCRVCGTRLHHTDRDRETRIYAGLRADGDLMTGSMFLGRYRILRELGRGGMGVVYKAEDTKLKRNVALKFLPPELTRDPISKERFIHEAQAASALDHPSICIVHEIDETDDGQMFISMGCYEGETLKDRIERGPAEVGEAVDVAIQVGEGLEDAHEKGIVHRDIKPSNIIVTTRGQARVMDFGLAKLAGQTRLTKVGTTMGTIAYMSPEQARGEDIDHRTDIWSLGVVLYEMLTGERPFKGEYDQAVIYSILNEDSRPLAELNPVVPPDLDSVVRKCLRKSPDERYQSSGELVADLMELSKGFTPSRYTRSHAAAQFPGVLSRAGLLKVGIPVAILALTTVLISAVPSVRSVFARLFAGRPRKSGITLAVLPCAISGGRAADTAFCYGMTKTFTDRLTYLERFSEGFYVIPSVDVRYLEDISPSGARRVLGANVVLTGTLDRSGTDISLRPVRVDFDVEQDGASEADMFMERRGRLIADPIANLSTWQDSILVELADLLDVELSHEARKVVSANGTSVPEAYILYVEGMGYLYPYGRSSDIDAALDVLERAMAADSSYVLARLGLGRAYYIKGYLTGDPSWYDRAVDTCDRALESAPDFADAHVFAGYALKYAGETDEAVDRFKQAVGIDALNFRAYVGMGETYQSRGDYEEALAAFSRAARLRPLDFSVQERLSYVYIMHGKFDQAIPAASRAIELRPKSTVGYNHLGTAYNYLHRVDEAREAFEQSLEIDSNYVACTNLGTIYFGRARYADAASMYKRALALKPNNYRIAGFLSEAYYWSPGQRELGIETFRQAIELAGGDGIIEGEDATLLSDLASYHARIRNSAKSESLLNETIRLEPAEWPILFRIADTLEQLGKRESALQWVEKAIAQGAPMVTMDHYPGLRELRADKRYTDIIKQRSSGL